MGDNKMSNACKRKKYGVKYLTVGNVDLGLLFQRPDIPRVRYGT